MTAVPVFETLGCRLNAYESEAMRELGRKIEDGKKSITLIKACQEEQNSLQISSRKGRYRYLQQAT